MKKRYDNNKMKIGLTFTGSDEKHLNYVKWLKGDENIEVIKLSADDANEDEVKNCDALVLSGGVDIHPEFYGATTNYLNAPKSGWKKDRDLFERSVFESALNHSIPVLGICRGLQLVNVTLNGTLIQDLGENLDKVHEGNPDKCHAVNIERETLLHDIVNEEIGNINSAHHQAVGQPGKGLKINSRANDGTIEGLEWEDKSNKPFLLCIQWHPERMFGFQLQDSPLSKSIRNRFIEEIKKSKANKK